MPNGRPRRTEGFPSLAARDHWVRYAAGIATETLFILCLVGVGVALAFAAMVVYR